jgi:hypothetical protein
VIATESEMTQQLGHNSKSTMQKYLSKHTAQDLQGAVVGTKETWQIDQLRSMSKGRHIAPALPMAALKPCPSELEQYRQECRTLQDALRKPLGRRPRIVDYSRPRSYARVVEEWRDRNLPKDLLDKIYTFHQLTWKWALNRLREIREIKDAHRAEAFKKRDTDDAYYQQLGDGEDITEDVDMVVESREELATILFSRYSPCSTEELVRLSQLMVESCRQRRICEPVSCINEKGGYQHEDIPEGENQDESDNESRNDLDITWSDESAGKQEDLRMQSVETPRRISDQATTFWCCMS